MSNDIYWSMTYDPERPPAYPMSHTDDLAYVGITTLSVMVTTKEGVSYRITNPDFLNGLNIERIENDNAG